MGYEEEYRRLNTAQRQAVDSIEGPMLVIAGPGTGKTQLLSMRVARILQKTDADPSNILCLTFTDAAAQNMRERLHSLIGTPAYHVGIYTFHGFGTEIIQKYPEYFTEAPLLQPLDELAAFEQLHNVFETLPHHNPLSVKVNDAFIHLGTTRTAIGWCKQAGLLPKNLLNLIDANETFSNYIEPYLQEPFESTPAAARLPMYESLRKSIHSFVAKAPDNSLATQMERELSESIDELDSKSRYAKSITTWRNRWLLRDDSKRWVLIDKRNTKMLKAFANVYAQFQKQLEKQGLYGFDDMILRTLHALKTQTELLLRLQEQYQYILVDEYQDTNGAQNQILELLANNPINEERPNLMVVGDDDQAIYRFQGAQSSIMLDFLSRWRKVEQITLTENYRSGQQLLDAARQVILLGEDRLEQHVENLSKELRASSKQDNAQIICAQTTDETEQYYFVAQRIAELIASGLPASSIAVLSPKHSFLLNLIPHLQDADIPITYERREHIFDQPHIIQLIELAKLITCIQKSEWQNVDALLPVVLAADYWQLNAETLWRISLEAYRTNKTWLEIISEHEDLKLSDIAKVLLELGKESTQQSLDTMFDYLVGNHPIELGNEHSWTIPYKHFYFNSEKLKNNADDYLKLLGQLKTLRENLHAHQQGKPAYLKDLVNYVHLYERSKLTLLDTSSNATSTESVNLMTAYKAKGLEWQTVFILGCHEDIWGSRVRSGSYSFSLPTNLRWIKPARETIDDHLRLFYVAMTRAKQQLYLMSYSTKEKGKTTEPLGWLTADSAKVPVTTIIPSPSKDIVIRNQELNLAWDLKPLKKIDLRSQLHKDLGRYRLSATHLASYLDITKGGPQAFLYRHLLHFPERMQPSALFGSAVHEALHSAHEFTIKNKNKPAIQATLKSFDKVIDHSKLNEQERHHLKDRGHTALSAFLTSTSARFDSTDKSEFGFNNEDVHIGPAHLTGKIDLIQMIDANNCTVIDYKTGNAFDSWRPQGAYNQVRAHLYKQQLVFYKLLVENASIFKGGLHVKYSYLQFVEPSDNGAFSKLENDITKEDIERVKLLIERVWDRIMNLDFPDTSTYSLDLKGLIAFEDEILN